MLMNTSNQFVTSNRSITLMSDAEIRQTLNADNGFRPPRLACNLGTRTLDMAPSITKAMSIHTNGADDVMSRIMVDGTSLLVSQALLTGTLDATELGMTSNVSSTVLNFVVGTMANIRETIIGDVATAIIVSLPSALESYVLSQAEIDSLSARLALFESITIRSKSASDSDVIEQVTDTGKLLFKSFDEAKALFDYLFAFAIHLYDDANACAHIATTMRVMMARQAVERVRSLKET